MDEAEFEELLRIQRMTLRAVTNESETDDKIKLMSIINNMMIGGRKKIQKESVIIEAQLEGMTETDVDRVLDLLKKDRMITEPEEGYVSVV